MTFAFERSVSRLLKTAAIVAAASTLFAASSNAAIESYSVEDSNSSTLTDWNYTYYIPKFNSDLGTLLSIEITLESTATTDLTVTNNALSASNGDVYTRIRLTLTSGAVALSGNLTYFVPEDPQSYLLNPGQTLSLGEFTEAGSRNYGTYTTGPVLANFTGAGDVEFNLVSQTQTTQTNSGGNTDATQVTSASGKVIVKYTYDNATAVPEPGTWAALAMGAGVLAYSARFRRRA